jgi:hypothetical protein
MQPSDDREAAGHRGALGMAQFGIGHGETTKAAVGVPQPYAVGHDDRADVAPGAEQGGAIFARARGLRGGANAIGDSFAQRKGRSQAPSPWSCGSGPLMFWPSVLSCCCLS